MRKRNLLLLVLLFAAAAATAGKVTYSAFVSTTSSAGNAFASGTVSIRDDDDDAGALLTLTAAKPGQSDTGCIEVTYDGSLAARVRLYATISGALAPYVTLTVTRGTDAAPAFKSCNSFDADDTDYIGAGAGVVYSGALSQFPSTWDAGIVDPTSGAAETWTTSETHSYRFVLSVNDDNANQGLSASVTFLWEARNLGSGGSGYRDAVLDTAGLVSYWRLGESSDTTAADAQGANNGTYENGVTLGTVGAIDESDTAASFDGLDDQVQIPDAASLQPAEISVEAWVKGGAGLEEWDSLLAKVSTDSWDDGYGVYWRTDGSLSFFVNNYAGQVVSTALPTDQWTHIVGTFDGSTMKLYKNGEEVASAPFATSITHSSAPLKIGAGGGAGPYAWAGEIDEVALYNVALTPAQIQAHYNAG